jgi:hypothetical protein
LAKLIITEIAKGKINNVKIFYWSTPRAYPAFRGRAFFKPLGNHQHVQIRRKRKLQNHKR